MKSPSSSSNLPPFFRKTFTKKELFRKIFKHLHTREEQDFVRGLLNPPTEAEPPVYSFQDPVSEETKKKLKQIQKTVRMNKGRVKKIRLLLLSFFLGALLVFNFFFKDRLISKKLTEVLESLTKSEVSLSGFHLGLLRGEVSFRRLSVANPDNAYRNLIELGSSSFRISFLPLLQKKVHIRKILVHDIRRNTKRKTPARTIKDSSSGKKKPPGTKAAPVSSPFPALEQFSPDLLPGLIRSYRSRLKVFTFLEESKELSRKRLETRKQELQEFEETSRDFIRQTRDLSEEISSFKADSPARTASLIQKIKDLLQTGKDLKDRGLRLNRSLTEDLEELRDVPEEFRKVLKTDYEFLADKLRLEDLKDGDLTAFLEPYFGSYYTTRLLYLKKALAFMRKIRARSEDSEKKKNKEQPSRRRSRTVSFAARGTPPFLIRELAGSLDQKGHKGSLDIRNITDRPDLLKKPIKLRFFSSSDSGSSPNPEIYRFSLTADGRKKAEFPLTFRLRAENKPLDFSAAALPVPLKGTGTGSFDVSGDLNREEDLRGKADITLTGLDASSLLPPEFRKAGLTLPSEIRLRVQFDSSRPGGRFRIQSNLDQKITEAVNRMIQERKEKLKTRLRDALGKETGDSLRQFESSVQGLRREAERIETLSQATTRALEELRKQKGELLGKAAGQVKKDLQEKLKSKIKTLIPSLRSF